MGDGRLHIGAPEQQPIALPTPAERRALITRVGEVYPELASQRKIAGDVARLDLSGANYEQHFVAALAYFSYQKRSETLDLEHSPWWHLEQAREWLRAHFPGSGTLISCKPFICAAVASGIAHGPLAGRLGFVELALMPHSQLPAPYCGWRVVLEGGLPREIELPNRPSVPVRPRNETLTVR